MKFWVGIFQCSASGREGFSCSLINNHLYFGMLRKEKNTRNTGNSDMVISVLSDLFEAFEFEER
jgi:hypothetical protein